MAIDVPVPRGSPGNSVKSTLTSVSPHRAKMAPPVLMLYVSLHFQNLKFIFSPIFCHIKSKWCWKPDYL